MHHGQYEKVVNALTPASVATSATAGVAVDTRGARWVQFEAILNSATAEPTTVKIQVGDTTTSFADVVELTGGTQVGSSVGFVIPTFDSAAAQIYRFSIDKKKYPQRYMKLQVTPAAAHVMAAIARLKDYSEEDILTTTEQGVALHVIAN